MTKQDKTTIYGLSAAKLLQEKGKDVIVLEARNRVGGRTYTEYIKYLVLFQISRLLVKKLYYLIYFLCILYNIKPINNSVVDYVDLGGSFVGPTQNRILRLADEFGIKTYLTYEDGDFIHYTNVSILSYSKRDAQQGKQAIPVNVSTDGEHSCHTGYQSFFSIDGRNGDQIALDAPWSAPHSEEWDNMTMQEFVNKYLWTSAAKAYAKSLVQVSACSELCEVSALWYIWFINSAGGPLRIFSTTNGGQERKFVGGSQQISIAIADKIGRDIYGKKYTANHVVMAIPPPLQQKITYYPNLPSLRNQLIQRIPMGSVIKTFMYYKTPFWRHKGFSGTSDIDDKDSLIGFTMDDEKQGNKLPAILGRVT
ncbi:hypothetical protein KUTeg_011864 [Tegillarca granosa]|uniref:monoamine oxidase n=1 Tax=Tegillarca granosa TaxID=220873 RepID=A0ABQ9EXW1_TEGGR|nr:hypothetical protein KUTeg_011864 [Tegillarca granosa]